MEQVQGVIEIKRFFFSIVQEASHVGIFYLFTVDWNIERNSTTATLGRIIVVQYLLKKCLSFVVCNHAQLTTQVAARVLTWHDASECFKMLKLEKVQKNCMLYLYGKRKLPQNLTSTL